MQQVERLLRRQKGLITRAQARAAGLTDSTLRAHLHARRWQRLAAGLYADFTGELGPGQRLLAACLHVGEGAQITGAAALRWYGLRYVPAQPEVTVLGPADCRRRSVPGLIRVVRTSRPDHRPDRVETLTIVSVARAVADEARQMRSLRAVRALVAESVQRRRTTVADLAAEVENGQPNGSALLRRALAEVEAGTRSAPEAELRQLLSHSRVVPPVLWNPLLRTPEGRMLCPDGWIVDSGIALEVDSREYHLGPDGWERTMRRHNSFAAADALTIHITPSELRHNPRRVLASIETAHEARRGRGRCCGLRVISAPFSA
jgi:hypothetical protein